MKKTIRFGALAAASALALAACASAPETEPTTDPTDTAAPVETDAPDTDYRACMVSDQGGFDDRSFNEAGHSGMLEAAADFGIQTSEAESTDGGQYAGNIDQMVSTGCDLIITVGFLLGDATAEAAGANPDSNFAIIDFAYDEPIDNIKPLLFDTDEAAFLAGYAAASATETGTVATFGGIPIPSVTIFMDGFLAGVNYYNDTQGTDVNVLGWDGENGSFSGDFEDLTAGQNIAQGFIDQGADIIMPVAGPVGLGAANAAQSAGDVWIIGVDQDWAITTEDDGYSDIILTSVMKQMGPAVYDIIDGAVNGAGFSSEPYFGTLENEGVGLAPFAEGAVSDEVLAALDQLTADIIAGTVETS